MSVSIKDIKHLAELAKLELTDKEIAKYRREISGIIRYVDRLAEANVSREEAMTRLSKNSSILREDLVLPWDSNEKELALEQAPRRLKKSIIVPKIFES